MTNERLAAEKRSHHGNEGNDRTNEPNGCVFSGELHSPRADSLRGRLPTSLHDSRFHREGSTIERSLYFAARKNLSNAIYRNERSPITFRVGRTVTEYENTRGSYLVCIVRIFANSTRGRVPTPRWPEISYYFYREQCTTMIAIRTYIFIDGPLKITYPDHEGAERTGS